MFDTLAGPIVAPIARNIASSTDLCSVAVVALVGLVVYAAFSTSFLSPRKY